MRSKHSGWLFCLLTVFLCSTRAFAEEPEVTVPKGTRVPLRFASKVSSKTSKVGEKVYFTVTQDVVVENVLAVKKDSRATGVIKTVKKPGMFGRSARVQIDLNSVKGVDDTEVPIQNITKTKKQGQTTAQAGAASIGGGLILGPIGVVGGLFVKGKHVEVNIGDPLDVEVKADTKVKGKKLP